MTRNKELMWAIACLTMAVFTFVIGYWFGFAFQSSEQVRGISNEDFEFLQEAKKYNAFDYRQIYATGKTTRPIIDSIWFPNHDANELFETYINLEYCIPIGLFEEWQPYKCSYGEKYWYKELQEVTK